MYEELHGLHKLNHGQIHYESNQIVSLHEKKLL